MQLITKEELAELIFENKEGMYRLAYTIVENDADAQDAVGDAIVKTFGNIQRLRKKTSAKSWLMQILVNSAHDICLLYTSPSPRDAHESRMPSSA